MRFTRKNEILATKYNFSLYTTNKLQEKNVRFNKKSKST